MGKGVWEARGGVQAVAYQAHTENHFGFMHVGNMSKLERRLLLSRL